MSHLLRRRPFVASLAAVAFILAFAALVVLPRLDGIEIAGGEVVPGGGASTVDVVVEVHYRLASSPGGVLEVRAPSPDGRGVDAKRRIPLAAGSGTLRVTLRLPARAPGAPVVAELEPAGAADGFLDALLRRRRRDVRVIRLRP